MASTGFRYWRLRPLRTSRVGQKPVWTLSEGGSFNPYEWILGNTQRPEPSHHDGLTDFTFAALHVSDRNEFVVAVDFIGLQPEDVRLAIDPISLTVSVVRTYGANRVEGGLVELPYVTFSRLMVFPQEVDPSMARGEYSGHRLTIVLPRRGHDGPQESAGSVGVLTQIGVLPIPDETAFAVDVSQRLEERAWILDYSMTRPFRIQAAFRPELSREALVDASLERPAPTIDVTPFIRATGLLRNTVALALYPSGAIRSLSTRILESDSHALVALDDVLALIDPDGPLSDPLLQRGLHCTLDSVLVRIPSQNG